MAESGLSTNKSRSISIFFVHFFEKCPEFTLDVSLATLENEILKICSKIAERSARLILRAVTALWSLSTLKMPAMLFTNTTAKASLARGKAGCGWIYHVSMY